VGKGVGHTKVTLPFDVDASIIARIRHRRMFLCHQQEVAPPPAEVWVIDVHPLVPRFLAGGMRLGHHPRRTIDVLQGARQPAKLRSVTACMMHPSEEEKLYSVRAWQPQCRRRNCGDLGDASGTADFVICID
jgi:hypothetical protein